MLITDAIRPLGIGLVENCICNKTPTELGIETDNPGCPVHDMNTFVGVLHRYYVEHDITPIPSVCSLIYRRLPCYKNRCPNCPYQG